MKCNTIARMIISRQAGDPPSGGRWCQNWKPETRLESGVKGKVQRKSSVVTSLAVWFEQIQTVIKKNVFCKGWLDQEYEAQAPRRRHPHIWWKGIFPLYVVNTNVVEHNDDDDLLQVEWQTDSRVGSRKNIQHRAGGGDVKVKIFFPIGFIYNNEAIILYPGDFNSCLF